MSRLVCWLFVSLCLSVQCTDVSQTPSLASFTTFFVDFPEAHLISLRAALFPTFKHIRDHVKHGDLKKAEEYFPAFEKSLVPFVAESPTSRSYLKKVIRDLKKGLASGNILVTKDVVDQLSRLLGV